MGDHVFICYSRKDENFVLKLATNLKNQGVPIWLDQWDIPFGANWDRTIGKALDECNRLLLVLSPASVESDDVQCEWRSALDEKKVVVPILYQSCHMPFRLKLIQYIDYTSCSPDDKESLEQILRALGIAGSTRIKPLIQKNHEPEKTSKWLDKGKALLAQYKQADAIKAFDTAIEIDPEYADAWTNKGKALLVQGKYDDAMKAFDKAIEIDPQNAQAWNKKGRALCYQGKYDDALKAYDMTNKLNPQDAAAWFDKHNILNLLRRTTEADAALSKAHELGRH